MIIMVILFKFAAMSLNNRLGYCEMILLRWHVNRLIVHLFEVSYEVMGQHQRV